MPEYIMYCLSLNVFDGNLSQDLTLVKNIGLPRYFRNNSLCLSPCTCHLIRMLFGRAVWHPAVQPSPGSRIPPLCRLSRNSSPKHRGIYFEHVRQPSYR
jgi:hypothetical protein